ncbi:hypothetical protein GCM10023229_08100 [Flavisolibacter ginsenosidimutans]
MEIAATIQQLSFEENRSIKALITGIGAMTTTYALTKAIVSLRPDAIIQAGVGGTLDEGQELGNVVAVQSEVVGDLGVQEKNNFLSLFDLHLLSNDTLPWTNRKLTNDNKVLFACGLPLVDGVTVNEISTNKERIEHYRTTYNAKVESMEGAALHYVGLMERIPFLQIRSLSNFIGERDKTKWAMQKAIVNLNRELQRILKNLTA